MQWVSYLANVNPKYDNYLFTLMNGYNQTAEKVIKENYDRMAVDIGKNNVVIKPLNDAITEAKKLFGIKNDADFPILILSHMHPLMILSLKKSGVNPRKIMTIIKISLGKICDEDKIRQILSKLISYVESEEYGKITNMNRIIKINNFIDKIPVIASVIELAI